MFACLAGIWKLCSDLLRFISKSDTDHPKRHQGHQPQSGTSKSSATPAWLQKCHWSLRKFLMPSNSSDFNQISNIASSGNWRPSKMSSRMPAPVRNIQIIINSSQKSTNVSIFEGVLDAFKLVGFQPNFKQLPQGIYRPPTTSSRTPAPVSKINIINSSKNFIKIIDLWGSSWCI